MLSPTSSGSIGCKNKRYKYCHWHSLMVMERLIFAQALTTPPHKTDILFQSMVVAAKALSQLDLSVLPEEVQRQILEHILP